MPEGMVFVVTMAVEAIFYWVKVEILSKPQQVSSLTSRFTSFVLSNLKTLTGWMKLKKKP